MSIEKTFTVDQWTGGRARANRPDLGAVAHGVDSEALLADRRGSASGARRDRRARRADAWCHCRPTLHDLPYSVRQSSTATITTDNVYDANGRLVPNEVLSVWRKKGDHITGAERTATNQAGHTYIYELPFRLSTGKPTCGRRTPSSSGGWRRCERATSLRSGPRDQRRPARLPDDDVRARRPGRAAGPDRVPERPRARDLQGSVSSAATAVPGGGRRVAVDPRLGYRAHALRPSGRRVRTAVERGPRAGQAAAAADAGHDRYRIR